jgi:hypothetical protein
MEDREVSEHKLPYEGSENYQRLLAMADPKQTKWDLSPNDVKAIGWAIDALRVFANRRILKAIKIDGNLKCYLKLVAMSYIDDEHMPDEKDAVWREMTEDEQSIANEIVAEMFEDYL